MAKFKIQGSRPPSPLPFDEHDFIYQFLNSSDSNNPLFLTGGWQQLTSFSKNNGNRNGYQVNESSIAFIRKYIFVWESYNIHFFAFYNSLRAGALLCRGDSRFLFFSQVMTVFVSFKGIV